jgi:hypothetical protein
MEDPISRGLVLPPARLEQVADYRDRSGIAHALRRLQGAGETEHAMTAAYQDPDQFGANESGGSGHKRGRPSVSASVGRRLLTGPCAGQAFGHIDHATRSKTMEEN